MTNPSADPLVGRTVAHYEILARLGGGGMGVVYKARDVRLGRIVALKFLPPQWSHDENAKQRFVREAQAASATDHRNICAIHDIASTDDGQLFIVMGYYEGPTLKQRLEAGALPIEEALDIATQVADGLARAHAQGVVHRDIKPGNLILAEDGVRILDFGLATFADALQLTVVGTTLGTAAYMSPEQARGEVTDARTDVWAAGVILYQMLAGHVPFRGAYAEAILHAIRNDTPAPIRATRSDVPEDVEQVVFRALHKDIAVRYASGRELARALRQVRGQTMPIDLRTEPVFTPTGAAATAKPRRSRKTLLVTAAAVVIALVGGGAWMTRPVARAPIIVVPVANQTGFDELDPYQRALSYTVVEQVIDSPFVRPLSWGRTLQTLRGFIARDAAISSLDVVEALSGAGGAQQLIMPTLLYEDQKWRVKIEIRDGPTGLTTSYESAPVASALTRETAYALAIEAGRLVDAHFRTGLRGWLAPAQPVTRLASLDAATALEEGVNWYEEQEYAAAAAAFERAAKLDPLNPLPQAWRSRAALLMRNDTVAAVAAGEAARLLTDDAQPRTRLFVEAIVAEARRQPGAEAAYRALIERYPDDVPWLAEMAGYQDRSAVDKEGWSAAIASYHGVLKADPGDIEPHLELCRLYLRLLETRKAAQEGELALASSRKAGWQGGEALARFCLVDALRGGSDSEQRLAMTHAESALVLLKTIGFTYNLPRAYYHLGLAAGEQGRLTDAVSFWEQANEAAAAGGNPLLQARVLNNLGVAHLRLGSGAKAAQYYADSAAQYQALGDQRGAARQQLNRASLHIAYGVNAAQALKDVENALAVTRQVGDPDFEVLCHEAIGSHYTHIGRYEDAARELNLALQLAQQRNLDQRVSSVRLQIARLHFEKSDYAAARTLLLPLIENSSASLVAQSWLLLGRVHIRLGDFEAARANLDTVRKDLEQRGDDGLRVALHEALGELSYEAGTHADARIDFGRAASSELGVFTDQRVIDARAYLGLLAASEGRVREGERLLQDSLTRAKAMGRIALEARCRIFLAQVYLAGQRAANARRVVAEMPPDAREALGVELRAQLRYWLGRAAESQAEAEPHLAAARRMLNELRDSLPETDRARFAGRREVRSITG